MNAQTEPKTEGRAVIDGKIFRRIIRQLTTAASKNSFPLVRGIYIKPEDGAIRFRATDLEIANEILLPVESVAGPGTVISARILTKLLSIIRGEIVLRVMDDTLLMIDDCRTAKLHELIEFDDYPAIPGEENVVWQDATWLTSMLPSLLRTVSDDESRAALTGVRWTANEIVSTDTHRLTLYQIEPAMTDWTSVVVPSAVLRKLPALLNIRPGDSLEVGIIPNQKFGPTNIQFRAGNTRVASRLTECTYPNYKKPIPTDSVWSWTVNSSELIAALRVVAPIADGGQGRVMLTRLANKLELRSKCYEYGEIDTAVILRDNMIHPDPDESESIAVNWRFLVDAMQVFPPRTNVTLEMTGPLSPIKITSDDYSRRLVVLMTMQRG